MSSSLRVAIHVTDENVTNERTKAPEVAVIIPARNEERWIRRALESVVAQRQPPAGLEVIVVDNGSTDGTVAVIQAFAAAHPFLALRLVHEPRRGVARAKNRAVRAARGRWLLFLDADSRMAPDLLTQVLAWACRGYPAGSIRIVADSDDWLDRAFFNLLEFGKRLFGIRAQMFYCERELFLRLGGFASTSTQARVCVRDEGVGIPPEELERIFERFYRVNRPRRLTGAGLGLYICREIIAAHGGHIWAESAGPGYGSRFCFTLPLYPPGTAER